METGTIIIASIFILICILPFILTRRNNKKRELQLFKELFEHAEKNKSILSHYELWSTTGIGIDTVSKILFLVKRGKDLRVDRSVKLEDYRSCRVINSTRTISHKEGNVHVTDKIELAFSPINKEKSEIKLELYNAYTDSTSLSFEGKFAEKWCQITNETIGISA